MTRFQYSKLQFEDVVKFISDNNEFFKGRDGDIRSALLSSIRELAEEPNVSYIGTLGFTVMKSLEEDNDGSEFWFMEILVDPGLGNPKRYEEDADEWYDSKSEEVLN